MCCLYFVLHNNGSKRYEQASRESIPGSRNAENNDVLNKVRHIENKFLNTVETSAQEAVDSVLPVPLRKLSREFQFINTTNLDETTFY